MSSARAQPTAPRVAEAGPELDALVVAWKATHKAVAQAKHENELAKSPVRRAYDELGVDVLITSCGTIPLQRPAPEVVVDWKALAEKFIDAKTMKKALPAFTTLKPKAPILSASATWSAELGLRD